MALCASGAYDKSPVHRSHPGFIVQMGSPASASPKVSTSIWDEPFEDEIRPSLRHNSRGIVSMANRGPNTNGSQFYICYAPQSQLDGKNTVFGKVIGDAGLETLRKLEERAVDKKGRFVSGDAPRIEGITVHANPLAT